MDGIKFESSARRVKAHEVNWVPMIAAFSAASKTSSMSFTWMSGLVPPGWLRLSSGRGMSLGQEVGHELVEVVWALQRHDV